MTKKHKLLSLLYAIHALTCNEWPMICFIREYIREHVPEAEVRMDSWATYILGKSCKIDIPSKLIENNGKAIKKEITVNASQSIKVRRVCNAIRSPTAKNMKKVICVELI